MKKAKARGSRRPPLSKSEQMARVRSSNTKPELTLRRELWRRGLRYRLGVRLPGRPDICFIGRRVAVFVDGCFWHGCPDHYTAPRQNWEFWQAKLERNMERDRRVDRELQDAGWSVLRLWEHQTHGESLVEAVEAVEQSLREA
ncbi:MAG: very short patch repair endonuclease [Actinomycetota bacterium]